MFDPHVNECIGRRSHAQFGGSGLNIRLDVSRIKRLRES